MFILGIILAFSALMGVGMLLVGGIGIFIGFFVGAVCMEALARFVKSRE